MGGSPDCTLRSTAVSSEPESLLVTASMGPSTPPPPASLVMAVAELSWPSIQGSPLPAKAIEAAPSSAATIVAMPTTRTVALPTDTTLLSVLLDIGTTSVLQGGVISPAALRNASTLTSPPTGRIIRTHGFPLIQMSHPTIRLILRPSALRRSAKVAPGLLGWHYAQGMGSAGKRVAER